MVFTQLGNEEVLEVFSPIHDGILEYTFSDGTKTKNTADHPYYVIDKGWCSNVPTLTNERYGIETNEFVCGDICVTDIDEQLELDHFVLTERKCRVCGITKDLIDGFYLIRKNKSIQSSYSYECKSCTIKRVRSKKKVDVKRWEYPDW